MKTQQMKLQINRISSIRNGGIAIEVSTNRADELAQTLQRELDTRQPKINRPKFKIYDIPSELDQENFSNDLFYEDFKKNFIPLFKTGPRDERVTQWIIEIGRVVRQLIPDTDRIYLQWQACKIKPYTILTRCYKCHRFGHSSKTVPRILQRVAIVPKKVMSLKAVQKRTGTINALLLLTRQEQNP